jgi:hypothetical protein
LGHRKHLLKAIGDLRDGAAPTAPATPSRNQPELDGAAERRQLTVMFCDMVGSTELSARLDAEDYREVIRAYQDACAGVIARFDGYVARFMGDGVLAYFGWPRAHEDDAARAINAGLGVVEAVAGLSQVNGAAEPVAVRIGIATVRRRTWRRACSSLPRPTRSSLPSRRRRWPAACSITRAWAHRKSKVSTARRKCGG